MKKRIVCMLIVLFILVSISACQITEVNTPETTEAPETFVTSTIIQNGESDYVIVYDGSTGALNLANELRNAVSSQFGVQLEVISAESREESGCEIVIGNCRPVAERTYRKLTGQFDFAMKVEENKLVLCAKDTISYRYLGEYLKREVFVKSDEGLALDSEDNIVYSSSDLVAYNYIDYLQQEDTFFELEELFAFGEYKNENITLPYRIYIPFNYSPEKEYPLYINLHGAGHRGNDNQRQLGFINPVLANPEIPLDDAIMIFPQCPSDSKWVNIYWENGSYSFDEVGESNELKALMELIENLQGSYSVDSGRIYLCGVSMGAYGVWNLLTRYPDKFAAGITMCGAGDPTKAQALKDVPIWAIHGDQDPTVPVSGSREMVEAIKNAGGDRIRYTELTGQGHDTWTYTYSSPEIFEWLFSQEKA